MHSFDSFEQLMDTLNVSHWGLANLRGMGGRYAPFTVGLVLIKPYSFQTGSDLDLYRIQNQTKAELEEEASVVCEWLEELRIPHRFVSGLYDSMTLSASVSHKELAAAAGLGWIGKSSLFVTEKYGPRVRLTSVLMDVDWPVRQSLIENRCGDCNLCIENCAYSALLGGAWRPGIDREELVDVRVCNDHRIWTGENLGYKEACGKCMLVCPWGQEQR